METVSDKFSGCCIGSCLGDALGLIVVGCNVPFCCDFAEKLQDSFVQQAIDPSIILLAQEKLDLPFGQYSGNSQLCRETLRSLSASKGWSDSDFISRFTNLFVTKTIFAPSGCGLNRVSSSYQRKEHKTKATRPVNSAGNNGLTRCPAVAIYHCFDSAKLVQATVFQTFITHMDPRCGAGSVAMALALQYCLTHQPNELDKEQFLSNLVDSVEILSPEVARALIALKRWMYLDFDEAHRLICKVGQDWDDASAGISSFVTSTLIWSLYCFLQHPADFKEAICLALRGGGATDATGHLTGSLVGALIGLQKLPDFLYTTLNDRGEWTQDDLCRLVNSVPVPALSSGLKNSAISHEPIDGEKVFTISNVLSPQECHILISYFECLGFEQSPVGASHNVRTDLRNNSRIVLPTETLGRLKLEQTLWKRVKSFLPKSFIDSQVPTIHSLSNVSSRFRVYKYTKGQDMGPHFDQNFVQDDGQITKLTMLIYLGLDDLIGGGTNIIREGKDVLKVQPATGKMLIFSQEELHEGCPVVEGTKYVLRSDVLFTTNRGVLASLKSIELDSVVNAKTVGLVVACAVIAGVIHYWFKKSD